MTRLGCAALALTACSREPAAAGPPRGGPLRYPVEVHAVETRAVEYAVSAVGSVEAFEVVQVTARVPGAVERVAFVEGDEVRAGQVLVEVEPQRYALALDTARAALARAEAAEGQARAALERRQRAEEQSPGLIKGEELESFRASAAGAAAELGAARTAVEKAELDLRDARVRAPVAGTIETRTAQTGQYVQPGVLLATLVRRDPLLLRFSVPEQDGARIHGGARAFFRVRGDSAERAASVVHVGDAADEATRMITVTARVDAPEAALRPGAFAEVRIPVDGAVEKPVIPQLAVRPSERGFLAYVVVEGVARERVLALGLRTAEGLVEVRSGLKAGEQLVVRGAEALRDGAPVAVVPSGAGKAGRTP
jgi:membrane fusion protein, multidrug efflux system